MRARWVPSVANPSHYPAVKDFLNGTGIQFEPQPSPDPNLALPRIVTRARARIRTLTPTLYNPNPNRTLTVTLTLVRHGNPDARLPAVAGEGGEALSAPRAEVSAVWMNGTLPRRVVLEIGAS